MQTLTQLPTHEEASEALAAGAATALHRFIHDNEPAGPSDVEFRAGLAAVIAEASAELSPATEQSGEAVAEVVESNGMCAEFKFEVIAGSAPDVGTRLYTHPQPAQESVNQQLLSALKDMIHHARSGKKGFARAIINAADAIDSAESNQQPAPVVPDGWRDVLFGNFDALEAAADSIDARGMNSHAEGIRAVVHALKQLAAAPQPAQKLPSVIEEIAAERRRQVEVEGWTPEHDDKHHDYTLARAAGCYAMHTLAFPAGDPPPFWPWDRGWWKPSPDKRRNWIKAAALLVAAIEREDRMAAPQPKEGGR
ncbi:hypothetical protein ACPRNU_23205 [Chromobacterium vaccinii]|uniref:hypothetical protein n=1 Tax=Chromobacterium vaccinii TaxID=1108595 RepID=UPI003C747F52